MEHTDGKRFSKRQIAEQGIEGGLTVYLEQINCDSVFSSQTIERYRQKSVDILVASGVDVDSLLADSPHGSGLRNHVLNFKELAPDSMPGLAARVLEIALHILAKDYAPGMDKLIPGFAFQFGRLTMLLDVYEIDRRNHAERRADKPTSDPYDSNRNERLRAYHAKLITSGAKDANKQTADEFGLSAKQVGRIVKSKRT